MLCISKKISPIRSIIYIIGCGGGKDNIKSQLDLQEMGIRSSFHLREVQRSIMSLCLWLITLYFFKKRLSFLSY